MYHPVALRPTVALAIGCHANPDRCLTLGGRRFPVCARCTGLVVGNIAAAGALAVIGLAPAIVGFVCLAPLALDGGLQALSGYRSTNPRRLATGVVAGFGQLTLAIGLVRVVLGGG